MINYAIDVISDRERRREAEKARQRERQRRKCEKHAYLNQPKFSPLAQGAGQFTAQEAKERDGDREGERDRES